VLWLLLRRVQFALDLFQARGEALEARCRSWKLECSAALSRSAAHRAVDMGGPTRPRCLRAAAARFLLWWVWPPSFTAARAPPPLCGALLRGRRTPISGAVVVAWTLFVTVAGGDELTDGGDERADAVA